MKVKELKNLLNDIPEDAEFFVYASYGESAECAYSVSATTDELNEAYDIECINWVSLQDVCNLNITAIEIGS